MSAWILLLMIGLQPSAPWADTYATTANAIAKAAEAEPLFAGEDGPARTAALLVAVAKFESNFKPGALGDKSTSVGLWQINQSNFAGLGITKAELLADRDLEVRAALSMMRASFKVCAARKAEDWLGHFASGGATCTNVGGLIASRHRVGLAIRLFRDHPPTRDGAI